MNHQYSIAAGSVPGHVHRTSGNPNQDAVAIRHGEEYVIAVVCDGATPGRFTEAPARIMAELFANELAYISWSSLNRERLQNTLNRIHNRFVVMKQEHETMDWSMTVTFAIAHLDFIDHCFIGGTGDGIYMIGDDTPSSFGGSYYDGDNIQLREISILKENIMIGSDGAYEAWQKAGNTMPDGNGTFGPLAQFHEKRFHKPTALQSYLLRATHESFATGARRNGILNDDCSIVSIVKR